ncbi:uncharacterized protein B0I36DRAFT_84324 [Microdochium trichocladiopsis]|uniref:Uncharacterized protein n=1 Tax=Microdochium trichocladiopsis TaxID=1682393 RepID=A0A9P8YBG1_9PEZI|nr:uncharacterized protein B0I36DRAFT_84324 [Microdochium trichocladiopsis]KAH7034805.1 hypothetical protein B0I36DRAFT_84324 [Microdochium trichocladiopsis]
MGQDRYESHHAMPSPVHPQPRLIYKAPESMSLGLSRETRAWRRLLKRPVYSVIAKGFSPSIRHSFPSRGRMTNHFFHDGFAMPTVACVPKVGPCRRGETGQ